jgi:uncharacterized membrane protein HdeD (DUF308 family)
MTDTPTPVTTPAGGWCSLGLYPWWLILLWGILALIIGAMFLASPAITTVLFITLLGAYWLVGGIFSLASLFVDKSHAGWKIVLGLLNIIVGIIILAYPLFSTLVLLEVFVILSGSGRSSSGACTCTRRSRQKMRGNAILGLISILFGIVLLAFPMIAILVPFIAGFFAIIVGICAIIIASHHGRTRLLLPRKPLIFFSFTYRSVPFRPLIRSSGNPDLAVTLEGLSRNPYTQTKADHVHENFPVSNSLRSFFPGCTSCSNAGPGWCRILHEYLALNPEPAQGSSCPFRICPG